MAESNADMRHERLDIRIACLQRGLSLRAAAERIGVSEASLRRLAKGEGVHPANAKRIADFFEVPVTALLPDTGERRRATDGAAA